MEDTMTTFLTPAFLAAEISLQVPTLSTSCAAADIRRRFLPGFMPHAIMSPKNSSSNIKSQIQVFKTDHSIPKVHLTISSLEGFGQAFKRILHDI
mmetsp:Transcript_18443/g.45712  ORF Transcript_18443/g.45712 Transcript_18443/m.45712 type:complete len:95 (+) Transcript_18443:1359-1643(+)